MVEKVIDDETKLDIVFSSKVFKKDGIEVSGYFSLNIDGEKETFEFTDCTLYAEEEGLYKGILKSTVPSATKELPVLVDFAVSLDFTDVVASVTMGTLEEKAGVLFFGETFDEYNRYANNYARESEVATNQFEYQVTIPMSNFSESLEDYSCYKYAGKSRSTVIDSTNGTKETVILCAAERDFDLNSEITDVFGYEIMRIYSCSNNALSILGETATIAPYEIIADFECNKSNFLDIMEVKPKESTKEQPGDFAIVSLFPAEAAFAYQLVKNLILVDLPGVTHSYRTAGSADSSVTVSIRANASDKGKIDLPATYTYSNAHENGTNGIAVTIDYRTGTAGIGSAPVYLSAQIVYQCIYQSGRTANFATGTATLSHSIDRTNTN